MDSKSIRNAWIVIDHPGQLIYALSISNSLRGKLKVNLLIQKHEYWKKYKLGKYLNKFSKVYWFDRFDYPSPSQSIILQMLSTALNAYGLMFLRIKLASLPIEQEDIIIGISQYQFLENLVISTFRRNKSISVVSRSTYDHLEKKPSLKLFEYSIGSFLTKNIQKIFGMHETVFIRRKNQKEYGNGDIFLSYKQHMEDVYDYVIVINNITENKQIKIKGKNNNVYFVSFPINFGLKSERQKRKKTIIFCGTNFLSDNDLSKESYILNINKCLKYLNKHYGGAYDLIYAPHPRESMESKVLDTTGFEIRYNKKPLEFFLLENKKNIEKIFAICSLAARSALNFKIYSYLFYPVFPFDKITLKDYGEIASKFPKESYIRSLNDNPRIWPWKVKFSGDQFNETIKNVILNN